MTCPACQAALAAGQDRCPSCGAMVAFLVEGALAPDPSRQTPPAPEKAAPIRAIPGLRRREKPESSWKDEVRERVQKRKRKSRPGEAGAELPLFRETAAEVEAPAEPPVEPAGVEAREPEALRPEPDLDLRVPEPRAPETAFDSLDEQPDLPLGRPVMLDIPEPVAHDPVTTAREGTDDSFDADAVRDEWRVEESDAAAAQRPVERPAWFAERLEAGAVDAALLGGLAVVVVYFASRAAHVPVVGLLPVWPWLAGYIGLLGLVYASYFTGTTGQTPGKMLFGLRVVEASGDRPGHGRALLRAAAGTIGSLVAGLGLLPLFFDPARRALHDRLFRTRVVKF